MTKEYKEDGVSWQDGHVFCYTDEYIETLPKRNKPYARKWNCVDPSGYVDNTIVVGSKVVDAFWSQVATWMPGQGDDWGEGHVLSSNIEGDGTYHTTDLLSVGDQARDYVYKILHSGASIIFGTPLRVILSLVNQILYNDNDPGLAGTLVCSPVISSMNSPLRDFLSNLNPVSSSFKPIVQPPGLTLALTGFDPMLHSTPILVLTQVTFDAIALP